MIPRQPLAHDLAHGGFEAGVICDWFALGVFAVVVAVNLFVDVAEQVERFDADLRALQATFQQ